MKKIVVYGSLKKGAYNHKRFGLGDPVGFGKVRGEMYKMYSYPILFEEAFAESDKVREHEVEVYEVDTELYYAIKNMEVGAGYYPQEVEVDGHTGTIFYIRPERHKPSDDLFLEAFNQVTVPVAYA